jgi:hypothetical protein
VTPTPLSAPTDAETIALSIDSGHVRAVRSYRVRTFEVFVAQASNDDGEQPGFNQSSQRSCELTVSARQMPLQVFSSLGFCEASC